ncbi:MAG: ABC transporter ATP-binding protein [Lachnospiraceae bacterium]|nr:ABC transporter ATP-binding protein [Lachnospiraceae bacterium]
MIELINAVKNFDGGVTAVNGVNLTFEPGKFYAIMGPSGSGKSTILNLIGGIEDVSSGSVLINGKDIGKMKEKEKAVMRMKYIGFIFQGFYLNPYLNAVDNVIVPMRINPDIDRKDMKNRAMMLIESVGLSERKKHYPNQMSGGEMQRVAIARAMANSPEVILADEPTGNLDEENEKMIFDLLKKLAQEGKTIIVVSHNETVTEYADKVIRIKKGKQADE